MARNPTDPGYEWNYLPKLNRWLFTECRIINGELYDVSNFYDEKTEDNEIEFKSMADKAFARVVNG